MESYMVPVGSTAALRYVILFIGPPEATLLGRSAYSREFMFKAIDRCFAEVRPVVKPSRPVSKGMESGHLFEPWVNS